MTPAAWLLAGTKDKEGNEVWKSRIGHFGAQELSNILLAFTRLQLYNQELLQVTPTPCTLSTACWCWVALETANKRSRCLELIRKTGLTAQSTKPLQQQCCLLTGLEARRQPLLPEPATGDPAACRRVVFVATIFRLALLQPHWANAWHAQHCFVVVVQLDGSSTIARMFYTAPSCRPILLTLGPVSATRMLMQLAVAGQLGCQLFVKFAYKFLPIGTLFQSFFDDCACRRLRWRQWENCKVVDASKTRQQFSIMLVVPAGKRGGGNITAADASCQHAAGSEQLAVELCFPSKCFGCLQATEVEAMAKLQVPHAMKPQAVTNLLWSFASLRYYPAKLLDFLVSKPLASHMQQHSPAGAWGHTCTWTCGTEVSNPRMQCCQPHP